ncbi:CgeB family protein [Bacillus sp. V3-13]|uniref:CgeB family protein n=1 Tax=Bacillus sp. V3-13 TaxID=2053728 RepID=UPI0021529CCB|nr:glycosyltransferase [Bacillus sp. V3-13]
MTGFILPKEMTEWLKGQNYKTAVWMTEDPYYMDRTIEIINDYDYVFTIDRAALDCYREEGHPNIFHLPLGTDPNTFIPSKNPEEQKKDDICLVGYPYPQRIELIKFLLHNTQYTIHVVGGKWSDELTHVKQDHRLKITDWKPPQEVAHYYNSAKIILNTHRPHDLAENNNSMGIINKSINNRTFDIAACGAFQLITEELDLRSYFSEEEIISFEGDEDLLEKIDFYINNDKERKRISLNAREKVLKYHTFAHRIRELTAIAQEINNI